MNVAGTARDAGVTRITVARYDQGLVDTLIGFWLPAWQSKARVNEIRHPKFYRFEPSVACALLGRIREPLEAAERGALLDTLVLHELGTTMGVHTAGGDLSYWRTPTGVEVDFIRAAWPPGGRRASRCRRPRAVTCLVDHRLR